MNVSTGHLVSDIDILKPSYIRVPPELEASAKRALDGRTETYISRGSRSKLARWAAGRRKAQKESRKKNRP